LEIPIWAFWKDMGYLSGLFGRIWDTYLGSLEGYGIPIWAFWKNMGYLSGLFGRMCTTGMCTVVAVVGDSLK